MWSRFLVFVFATVVFADCARVFAQGKTVYRVGPIVYTVLTNDHPGGLFEPEGVPVYNPGGGGPYSSLSVDLNHDGIEDYRVVATGTVTFGFQMEGVGSNAVWARPEGGMDMGSMIVPLAYGTCIGPTWSCF